MADFLTYLHNRGDLEHIGHMPDENYAREILQLFSIGLVELNMDGTPRLDTNGRAIETFDNTDIVGLARVFTGITMQGGEFYGFEGDGLYSPIEIFEPYHSPHEKTFLGTTIPAGTPGSQSLTMALDTIFEHPNVAPFVSRQLIQRFSMSNPPPAYVESVAMAFETGSYTATDGTRFGTGRRGDLQATLAAILLDSRLRQPENSLGATDGKIREPVLRFTTPCARIQFSGSQCAQ